MTHLRLKNAILYRVQLAHRTRVGLPEQAWSMTCDPVAISLQNGERTRFARGRKSRQRDSDRKAPPNQTDRHSKVRPPQQHLSLRCDTTFSSFRFKCVNPNCQDETGNTPLHHAALNGHKYCESPHHFSLNYQSCHQCLRLNFFFREAVHVLLDYNASNHIPDNTGK